MTPCHAGHGRPDSRSHRLLGYGPAPDRFLDSSPFGRDDDPEVQRPPEKRCSGPRRPPKIRLVLSPTSRFLESGGPLTLNGLPSPFVLVDFVKRLYKNTLAKGIGAPVCAGIRQRPGKVGKARSSTEGRVCSPVIVVMRRSDSPVAQL